MARTPAPPGPPPPHYRPPGTPRPPSSALLPSAQSTPTTDATRPGGIGTGAATALALAALLVGVVAGFFIGRAYDEADDASLGPLPTTAPDPAPSTSRPPGDTIPQRPPAPPGTEMPAATIGSLEDPVPAGQAYVLGLYEIEVRGVDRDAAPALAEHSAANPAPPEGQRHVLVELAVRFTDATGLGNPGSIPFFVSDGSDEWFGFDASCGQLPRPLAEAGLIEQGDEAVGQVCFTVPADVVDDLALGTESFAGPLYFALP